MAQPPVDPTKGQPDVKLASELERLRIEFTDFRNSTGEQVKQLMEAVSQAGRAAEVAAKNAEEALAKVDGAIKAAEAASASAKSAEDKAVAASTAAKASEAKVAAASTTAKAAKEKADAADRRASAAETAAKKVTGELGKTSKQVEELLEALGNGASGGAPPAGKPPPFLTIHLRETEFDPIVTKALSDIRASLAKKVDIDKLSRSIVDNGLATSIGKVSQTLSRSRIPEARRNVLAAAYPSLLKKRLGDPIKADLAKDAAGLSQNLLIELEPVLDDFAKLVVKASEDSLSLNLQDTERKALFTRVRESI